MATKKVVKKEAPILNQEQADAAIKDKALELGAGKYSPEQFENFMAALNAKCLYGDKARIESFMKQRDYAKLGLCVMNAIVMQLDAWAYSEACELYNSTLGGGEEL
jgi:hypothetical protein